MDKKIKEKITPDKEKTIRKCVVVSLEQGNRWIPNEIRKFLDNGGKANGLVEYLLLWLHEVKEVFIRGQNKRREYNNQLGHFERIYQYKFDEGLKIKSKEIEAFVLPKEDWEV